MQMAVVYSGLPGYSHVQVHTHKYIHISTYTYMHKHKRVQTINSTTSYIKSEICTMRKIQCDLLIIAYDKEL